MVSTKVTEIHIPNSTPREDIDYIYTHHLQTLARVSGVNTGTVDLLSGPGNYHTAALMTAVTTLAALPGRHFQVYLRVASGVFCGCRAAAPADTSSSAAVSMAPCLAQP